MSFNCVQKLYYADQGDVICFGSATGSDEMCNFYMMYYYDPAEGHSTDSCGMVELQADKYPSETNVPLDHEAAEEMNMKRYIEGTEISKKSEVLCCQTFE